MKYLHRPIGSSPYTEPVTFSHAVLERAEDFSYPDTNSLSGAIMEWFTKIKLAHSATYSKKSHITSTIKRLLAEGMLTTVRVKGKKVIRLSTKGRALLLRYRRHVRGHLSEKGWDGTWHIVIFDIKEASRRVRQMLRKEITHFGFVHLQHSVWVTPYPCEEFLALVKADYKMGKDILYIRAEKIEGDAELRKTFQLPLTNLGN